MVAHQQVGSWEGMAVDTAADARPAGQVVLDGLEHRARPAEVYELP